MKKYIIALDQGTTSSRAMVFDHEGNIIASAQKELTQIYPRPGYVEQDPLEIYASQSGVCLLYTSASKYLACFGHFFTQLKQRWHLDTSVTVSYTHLDVYKRQTLCSARVSSTVPRLEAR